MNQPAFVAEILRESRTLGIHTAMETSFYASYESIEEVLPWLDVLYIDLKLMDKVKHKEWVGKDNSLILGNIRKAAESPCPLQIIVRIPMIPGVNDSDENLAAVAGFCKSLPKLREIELLAYHRLGLETYRHLGREYSLKDLLPPAQDMLWERAVFLARRLSGVPVRAGGRLAGNSVE